MVRITVSPPPKKSLNRQLWAKLQSYKVAVACRKSGVFTSVVENLCLEHIEHIDRLRTRGLCCRSGVRSWCPVFAINCNCRVQPECRWHLLWIIELLRGIFKEDPKCFFAVTLDPFRLSLNILSWEVLKPSISRWGDGPRYTTFHSFRFFTHRLFRQLVWGLDESG